MVFHYVYFDVDSDENNSKLFYFIKYHIMRIVQQDPPPKSLKYQLIPYFWTAISSLIKSMKANQSSIHDEHYNRPLLSTWQSSSK